MGGGVDIPSPRSLPEGSRYPLGGGVGIPDPRSLPGEVGIAIPHGYCHLVVATEAGSTHPTGMLSC